MVLARLGGAGSRWAGLVPFAWPASRRARATRPDRATVRTILVVLLCPLGDTLFATPALRALRHRFPAAEITALCWTANEPLLRHNPHLDRVVACPGGWELAVSPLRMLDRRFDLGVGLSHFGSWVTPFFRARMRVGFQDVALRRGRLRGAASGALTGGGPGQGEAAGRRGRELHAIEYCLAVVARVGARPHGLHMELVPGAGERRRAAELLGGAGGGPLVAFHVGADHFPAKRWPPERFARLADELARRHGARIVLVGGPGDVPLARRVRELAREASFLDLTGRLALLETAAVLERVDVLVGNDSGPLHMAEAVGTPVVGLFGPSDPRHFAPLDPRHRVLVGTCDRGRRCIRWLNGPLEYLQAAECRCQAMETIPVPAVAAAVTSLLQERPGRRPRD